MEEEEGVKAEPLGASARLGVAGGHGYGDDDGELRSVVCARGEQRRGWGPGGERRGAGGEATAAEFELGSRSSGARRKKGGREARRAGLFIRASS